MRAGGVRGGIFAVFTASPDAEETRVPRPDGVLEFAPTAPVDHAAAAANATAAAGRLHALERAGELRIARRAADLDAAREGDGPPAAVLHLEGAEAIDPGLEALELWYAAGLRSLGPVWSRPNAFGDGVPFVFPSSPDTGPGLTPAGTRSSGRAPSCGILVDVSHLNEKGFWDLARLELGPIVASHAGAHALSAASRNLTDASSTRSASPAGWWGSFSPARSCARISPTTRTRRSS